MKALIPAKANSERLPNKNMALLKGMPLIQYTIDAAKKSGIFDEVIVSTNDMVIQRYAELNDCSGFIRSPVLSKNHATVYDVCKELVKYYKDDEYCLLLPTSPLRTADDIKSAYEKFKDSDAECLMSVIPLEHPPQWSLVVKNNQVFAVDYIEQTHTRHDIQELHRHDGSIIMFKGKEFEKHDDWLGMSIVPYFSNPLRSIDINTARDLKIAQCLM